MLDGVIREAARRYGDRPAYVAAQGWPVSYRQLDEASDEVAAGLLERGIRPGDVVALALPPAPEYIVAYLATAKVGAVAAGVNTRLSAEERDKVLAVADPAVVLDPDSVGRAGRAQEVLAPLRVTGGRPPPLPSDPERPLALVFTSGTTGTPKGAVFGGRQLATVTDIDLGGRWGLGGRTFAGTSFAHLGFMTKFPGALQSGGTTWLTDRWTARDCLRMIAEHRMTSVGGIPTQVALLLQQPDFDDYDVSSVKAVVVGGGPAPAALVREARARIGAPVAVRYSYTESGIGLGTELDSPEEDAEVSVGRPRPGVELIVVDERDRPLPAGEVGEVCLRSTAVMFGYYRDPDATAAAFTDDGFVRSGDLGWVDPAGRLRLVGRTKEMYVRGGYNVYPMEVEGVLASHPAVAAVAVVPRTDPVMGEVGVAFVVARAGSSLPSLEDLRDFGRQRLAGYKLPEQLELIEALPLTAMEKVDRRALAARLATVT